MNTILARIYFITPILFACANLALAAGIFSTQRWRRLRPLAVACGVLAGVQLCMAFLADTRSTEVSAALGWMSFLAITGMSAMVSGIVAPTPSGSGLEGDGLVRGMLGAGLGASLVEMTLGLIFRHFHQPVGKLDAAWAHLGFSIVVVILSGEAGFLLRRRGDEGGGAGDRRVGTGIVAIVGLQFLLGAATLTSVLAAGTGTPAPPEFEQFARSPVSVIAGVVILAHQLNGAALMGLLAAGFTRLWMERPASVVHEVRGRPVEHRGIGANSYAP